MKKNTLLLALTLLCALVLIVACGGGDGDSDPDPTDGDTDTTDGDADTNIQTPGEAVGSCTLPGQFGVSTCSDYSNLSGGVTVEQIKTACNGQTGATWSDSGCDHSLLAGGCNMPGLSGYTMVAWYLKSTTVDEALVKTTCSSMKGEYIAP